MLTLRRGHKGQKGLSVIIYGTIQMLDLASITGVNVESSKKTQQRSCKLTKKRISNRLGF